MGLRSSNAAISAVAALDDPVRKALYDTVRQADRPLTREDAAATVGISRKLAAFHLDKLVAAGLLRVGGQPAERPRQAGRIPKTYEVADDAVQVSLPHRAHEDLVEILLDAFAEAPGPALSQAARRAARTHGLDAGEAADRPSGRLGAERALTAVEQALDARGYEPYRRAPDRIALRNCPFHLAARSQPKVVCELNLELCRGLLDGMAADSVEAMPVATPGECCVEIRAVARNSAA